MPNMKLALPAKEGSSASCSRRMLKTFIPALGNRLDTRKYVMNTPANIPVYALMSGLLSCMRCCMLNVVSFSSSSSSARSKFLSAGIKKRLVNTTLITPAFAPKMNLPSTIPIHEYMIAIVIAYKKFFSSSFGLMSFSNTTCSLFSNLFYIVSLLLFRRAVAF